MKYVYSLIIRVLICFIPMQFFRIFLEPLTISLSYALLIPFGARLFGNIIQVSGHSFEFIDACIAVSMYYLIFVLVMLTKDIRVRDRIRIILMGFGMLLLMNIIRVVVLVLLTVYFGYQAFDIVHLVWWKFMSGIYVAFVWIFLVKYYKISSIPIWDDLKELIRLSKGE